MEAREARRRLQMTAIPINVRVVAAAVGLSLRESGRLGRQRCMIWQELRLNSTQFVV